MHAKKHKKQLKKQKENKVAKQKIRLQQKYKDMLLDERKLTLDLAKHFNTREQSVIKLINTDGPTIVQENYIEQIRLLLGLDSWVKITEKYTK